MSIGFRELLFLIVLIAMPVSSYWFVFRPQNTDIEAARKEIEHKEQMLEKLAKATARNDDLKKINEEIAAGISTVESRLPDNKEVDVILGQVSTVARSSRLALPKVRSANPVPSAKYMEQPLEMLVTGDFDDFYRFLTKVEELDRITRVPDMKIKKINDVDGAIEATFTLSIYFEPAAAATANAGTGGER
ncbi:MAG: type 4a pilus biogenesis protein PilO [Phycisphaerae bacterium]|nr:type 4a pilus biogenesis protein PilO [Phycisphaerae bacterium]